MRNNIIKLPIRKNNTHQVYPVLEPDQFQKKICVPEKNWLRVFRMQNELMMFLTLVKYEVILPVNDNVFVEFVA